MLSRSGVPELSGLDELDLYVVIEVTNANLLETDVIRDIHDFTTPEMVTEEVDGDQAL